MGLFDSLAMGAGRVGAAAASGLLAGQQAEAKQRHLDALMNYQYAKLQEGQAGQSARLTFQQHQAQGRLVAPLIKQRYDQGMQRYWDDNPDMAAKVDRIINAHMSGTAFDPGDMAGIAVDPNSGSVHLPGAGGAGTTAPPPDTGPAPPPPSLSLPGGISGVGLAGAPGPDPQLSTPAALAGIGQAPPPPAPGFGPDLSMPSSVTGMGAPPHFALGRAPAPGPAVAGPPIPAPIQLQQSLHRVFGSPLIPAPAPTTAEPPAQGPTAPAEPAAPPSLADQLRAKYQAGPRRHQTDKAFKDEIATEAKIAGIDLREVMTGATVPFLGARAGEARVNTARGLQKIAEEPTDFEAKQKNLAARTAGTEATTAQTLALTPERVTTLQHDRRVKDQQLKIAASNLQRSWADLREKIRNNTATLAERKRVDDATIGYRDAATTKIQNLIDNGDAVKMSPQDKTALQTQQRVYFTGNRDQFGDFHYQFTDPMRRSALQSMNAILGKYGSTPIVDPLAPSGGATQSAGGSTMGPTHSSVGAPEQGPAVTSQNLAEMKAAIVNSRKPGGRSLHDLMGTLTNPGDQAKFRAAYQQATKQPWPG